MDKLRLKNENTLLGVDLVFNNNTIAKDVNEKELLSYLKRYDKVKIIITIFGGQGYIFSREINRLAQKL
jgi:predicted polyphosphate/ATP-dependent NAD kinase